MNGRSIRFIGAAAFICAAIAAGQSDSSDPAKVPTAPLYAIGFGNRDPNLDVLPGFKNPPPGYGEVAFFWWLGDPLTKERLRWQLDQLAGKGVMGLQINYAHSDSGGHSWGLTYASEPPLFSEAWWKLVGWFIREAKKRGMAVSLSDYTLGIGQGFAVDEVLKKNPDLAGSVLQSKTVEAGAGDVQWPLPANTLSVAALDPATGSMTDLRGMVADNVLNWTAPGPKHRLVAVFSQAVEPSIDPMNPKSGPAFAETFFGSFEERFPGEPGKGLNFFFSDELGFGVAGNLWSARFPEEFKRRKGYDILPLLPALFYDIGPRTPKIRLDYSDVKVALSEEGYFKPIFDWHQQRGIIYGCDHGGRGRDVVEFGDYFRTQRWNQGPGCDQPNLGRDIIKNKVASSIAHLYLRPRTWLEGFYGSGWGTSSEQVADATFANFAQGHNLLTLHGLYYSTHGGWWEWAPPCNHWRMPYWAHMGDFLKCTERLSYLLSQGYHRCDAAILYPVAPMEAGLGGKEAVDVAFSAVEHLYRNGIDLDFIDFESVARAKVEEKELGVSGERYRVLILPAMRAVRWSTIRKALEFHRVGGLVLALGDLPEASDRAGRDDPELDAAVKELFDDGRRMLKSPEQAVEVISRAFQRDFAPAAGSPHFLHRRAGGRDIFMIYGLPKGTECSFRATGVVELWDPWTGATRTLPVLEQSVEITRLRSPLTEKEVQVIVFSPGRPVKDHGGPEPQWAETTIGGEWHCEFKATLDNRWGDFRWPAFDGFIGPEARKFRYRDEAAANPGWEKPGVDDSQWPRIPYSYGPQFMQLGPLPDEADVTALEAKWKAVRAIKEGAIEMLGGETYTWRPYAFSWRYGVEGDPGHQGYHGLKEELYDEFIRLGKLVDKHRSYVRKPEDGGTRYYLWTSISARQAMKGRLLSGGMKPAAAWLNGQAVSFEDSSANVLLQRDANALLLRYDGPGTGYVVAAEPSFKLPLPEGPTIGSQEMRWNKAEGLIPFDVRPGDPAPAGWYRFQTAPGTKSLIVTARGKAECWVDGKPCRLENIGGGRSRFYLPEPSPGEAVAALRIEQERGVYGGAAIAEPVAFECITGRIQPGDWSQMESLESYSGGLWYRKTITLERGQTAGRVLLDLGNVVSSAELHVNGRAAGARVAPPWQWDVTKLVKPGKNLLEVLVFNTLGNHYTTIPTRYRGQLTSGMLGPVKILAGELL